MEKQVIGSTSSLWALRLILLALLFVVPLLTPIVAGGSRAGWTFNGVVDLMAAAFAWAERKKLGYRWAILCLSIAALWLAGIVIHTFFIGPGGGARQFG